MCVAGGIQSNIRMKRARAANVTHKGTTTMYNKITDLVATMSELVNTQELTDTIILQVF